MRVEILKKQIETYKKLRGHSAKIVLKNLREQLEVAMQEKITITVIKLK